MRVVFIIAVICVILSINSFVANAGVDPNLIIYLPMDDGKGDVVKDLSPNGFDGKIIGKDYKWINGKNGGGLEFVTGTNIQVESNDMLHGMKALTLEIWSKQDTHQSTNVIRKGANWPDMSYLSQPWSDQQIYFGVKDTSSRAIAPAGSYALGKWYHTASVFDGQNLFVYVDGVEKSKAKAPVNQVPETPDPLLVGAIFTGSIDDFVMYNRALTENEVKKDMAGISMSVALQGKLPIAWGSIKNR